MYFLVRILAIGMDCLSGMLILTPVLAVFQKLRGRKVMSVSMVFLLLYLCTLAGIFSVTGLPNIKYMRLDLSVNCIPMIDILSSPSQYLLNILMFVPIGFFLPLIWKKYGDWRYVLGFACFLTVFIEAAQVFTFRTTDIDDLLTNLLGAGLGCLIVRALADRLHMVLPASLSEEKEPAGGPFLVFFLAFLVNFFIQPYWSAFFWDRIL